MIMTWHMKKKVKIESSKDTKERIVKDKAFLFDTLLHKIPVNIYFKNLDSKFILCSDTMIKHLDANNINEIIGKSDFDFYDTAHAQEAENDEKEIIKTNKSIIKEEKEIHKNGDIKYCITIKSPLTDKEGNIIGTFGMTKDTTELIRSKEKINLINRELTEKNKILKKSLQKLEKTKKELEYANAIKNKFFGLIEHNFKDSFNSIIGCAELLSSEILSEKEIKNITKEIKDVSNSTYLLFNNLLLWSKIQTGNINFELETFDIGDMINDEIYIFNNILKNKNIKLNKSINKNILVKGDKIMISTAIKNIIDNAIKYSNENGEITVSLFEDGNNADIIIKDNGIGIDEEIKKYLFKLSNMLYKFRSNQNEGTGLGLIIVKEFIEKNKGTLNINSKKDSGTEIEILLPKIE